MIGAGNMGYTFAEGMSTSPLLNERKLMVLDRNSETRGRLEKTRRFDVYERLEDCLPQADIVFVAVKPYHCEALFAPMRPLVNGGQLIVSMMAGVTIQSIQEMLGVDKVIRTMPRFQYAWFVGFTGVT